MPLTVERVGLAAILGLLVGLERFRAGKTAGIRTFALIALAGSLSQLAGARVYGAAALGLTGIIVAAGAMSAMRQGDRPQLTTSTALIVTAFLGILVGQGRLFAAVAGAIATLLLLAWKEEMADFSRHLTREEVHAAVMLLLLGAVILPLLPATPVDRWGLVNLRRGWIMVVLISGIGFANYLLLRRFGPRGVPYAGFLGGFVNSTATVIQFVAPEPAHGARASVWALPGILFAKAAMLIRNALILALFAPPALRGALVPLGCMAAASAGMAFRSLHHLTTSGPDLRLESPFSLRAALEFGVIFMALTVAGGAAHRVLGVGAFYAVAFIGGMVSSATSIAAAALLAHQGALPPGVAGLGVVLSSVGSTVVLLLPLLRMARRGPLAAAAARSIGVTLAAGAVGLALTASALGTSPGGW